MQIIDTNIFLSPDRVWLCFREARVVQQREEDLHDRPPRPGHLQRGLHHPRGVGTGGSK